MREKHNDTQQLLLLKKLLDLRDSASPFTLVLDTIEQSAKPLLQEYLHRAKVCVSRVNGILSVSIVNPDVLCFHLSFHNLYRPMHQMLKNRTSQ